MEIPELSPPFVYESSDVKDMTNPTYLMDLAMVHLRYGALERAEPLLRTALEQSQDPRQKQQIISSLGTLLQRKGDWKGMAEMSELALAGNTAPGERFFHELT